MSIRYTLRHNIPSNKLAEEDVNDSSTWDLNLLRKHELAETDNHDIVYRKHDGEVVNWVDAATQQANEILEEVQDLSAHIDNQAEVVLAQLEEVSTEVSTLTEEAQEANEAAQDALVQARLAVTESQESADSASWSSTRASEWASKTDGKVDDNEYSSKYYAIQSSSYARNSANSATVSQQAATAAQQAAATAAEDAAQDAVEDVSSLLESYVTDATNAKNGAISAKTSAETAATNSATSATLSQNWATKTSGKVDGSDYSAKYYAQQSSSSASTASTKATEAATSATSASRFATNASTSANNATTQAGLANSSATSASASADLAKAWATKTNGKVDSTEYSSKYYAEQSASSATSASSSANLSEQWATKTSGTVDGTEYSAKYYAEQAQDAADDLSESLEQIATNTANIEENAENIATNTGNIAQNTGNIAQNTTDIDIAEKRIGNIEKLLQGNLYDYQTDSTSAYTKSVPQGAMPYASLDSIGGKTVVWNQLVSSSTFPTAHGENGGTTAWNGTEVTYGGTVTSASWLWVGSSSVLIPADNHIYLALTDNIQSDLRFGIITGSGGFAYEGDNLKYYRFTNSNGIKALNFRIPADTVVNFTAHLMLFDLTLMFGSGNEPASITEFQQMFPASYYHYNAGTLLSAGVTEVKSVGKNLADISIVKAFYPSLVTIVSADEFTFVSSGSMSATNRFFDNVEKRSGRMSISYSVKYNSATSRGVYLRVYYTDGSFDRLYNTAATNTWRTVSWTSSATKTVDYVAWSYENVNVLATFKDLQIEWGTTATSYSPYKEISTHIPAEVQALEGYGWSAGSVYNYIDYERKVFVQNVARVDLGTLTWNYRSAQDLFSASAGMKDFGQWINPLYVYKGLYSYLTDKTCGYIYNHDLAVKDSSYNGDADAFASAMSGVYEYYELATPIETDISAYLTDDNLISVEAGGTLTFPNSNGTDYQIPVPSTETYMVDLQASL